MPEDAGGGKATPRRDTIKCFCCDLNWARAKNPPHSVRSSVPQDWAAVDAQEYFDWHREFGNNVTFLQAYAFGGYAFYPTKLGPVAAGKGGQLLPRLLELSRKAGLPFWSYFCVGTDLGVAREKREWVIPDSAPGSSGNGFLAPESPWTDLLCDRIREFLAAYPVDWILFDWFVYADLHVDRAKVRPAEFVKKPFQEIIGRPMPERADDITPAEHLKYKREVLARQFRRIRDTIRQTSRQTKFMFNVPYWEPDEKVWAGHPMLEESDGIFAECTEAAVMEWALRVRKPGQRVMTTIVGRQDGVSDPSTWRRWHARGCDFFGYAWGAPPDFRPLPLDAPALRTVREAFKAMS